jgi:hypothetical protein
LGIYRNLKPRNGDRFYVEEAGPSDVAEFFIQCHLRENLIHSRFNVSGTLLTLCVERADRQAGEEQSMQVAYFHKRNWLGVDKKDGRNLVPVRRTVPPMTE